MGQSLAHAAVSGTSKTLTDEKRELLAGGDIEGLMSLNRHEFGGFTMKADDDADDDEDLDEDDEEDDDDADDDDDDDDEDEDKGKKKPDAKDRRIKELSAESAKHRKRASTRGRRIAELEAEIAGLKKAKPAKAKAKDDEEDGDEPDDSEAKELKAENVKLAEKLVHQQLRSEFSDLISGAKPLAKFIDPKAAFKLLDLDDVEIEDDGEIIGLDEAIKDLAKSKPYLLDKGKDDEDDEDDDDEDKPRRRRTGQPSGTRRKKSTQSANRDKLLNKYPALRR